MCCTAALRALRNIATLATLTVNLTNLSVQQGAESYCFLNVTEDFRLDAQNNSDYFLASASVFHCVGVIYTSEAS